MKICTICKNTKNENDFYFKNKIANKLHSQCKACYSDKRRRFYAEHYQKYGSDYRERALLRNKKLKANLRIHMTDYLSDKFCVKCGIKDPRVLDFDHLDPDTKSFGIAKGLHGVLRWDKILLEIEKCQILCANCHRIRTAEQQGWYKTSILPHA